MGSPGAGGGLLGDSPARVYFAHASLASFSFSPPMHLSACLGVLTYVTLYPRLFCLLHWDSTDGDQHNDVCQHVRIRHKMWLRLVGLWRSDACNRYIIRMQTLTHTHTHARARARTHTHNPAKISLNVLNYSLTNPSPYFHYCFQVFCNLLVASLRSFERERVRGRESVNRRGTERIHDRNQKVERWRKRLGEGVILIGIEGSCHCATLQHTATHCNTLQHTTTGGGSRQDKNRASK